MLAVTAQSTGRTSRSDSMIAAQPHHEATTLDGVDSESITCVSIRYASIA
jgi:hypothetical protein